MTRRPASAGRGRRWLATGTVAALLGSGILAMPSSAGAVADPCGAGFPAPDVQTTVTHPGDLVLSGNDALLIENQRYVVDGNVLLSGDARLELRNAELVVQHYPRQELEVLDRATVVADNAVFEGFVHALVADQARFVGDRVFLINLLNVTGEARADITGSCLFEDRFGLVQAGGRAQVTVTDSVVGAVGLELPDTVPAVVDGLRPGYFTRWSVRENVSSQLDYDVVLTRTTVQENPGYSGGYEMGWNIFTSERADLTVRDSVLNKLVVEFVGHDVTVSGLTRGSPVDVDLGGVRVRNTNVQGQWGVFVTDGELRVSDSDGVWLWPVGSKDTIVSNTAVNEFDPRRYTGTIRLTDSSMTNGFEVFNGSVFRMEGTIDMRGTSPLFTPDSFMTREYPVQVLDAATGAPVAGIRLRLTGPDGADVWSGTTASTGAAAFEITFGRDNNEQHWVLGSDDPTVALRRDITIGSDTPVRVWLVRDPDGSGWVPSAAVDCAVAPGGDGGPRSPLASIQEALETVGVGGVVSVAAGTCRGDITLTEGVLLQGAGPGDTTVEGNVFAQGIDGAVLRNLTVMDQDTAGIHCYDASLTVTNTVVRDQPHNGIHADNCRLTAVNDTLVRNGHNGILLIHGSVARIENTILSDNGIRGVDAEDATATLRYNDAWHNADGAYAATLKPGPGALSVDPRFVGAEDLRLRPDSPCLHAGNPAAAYANPDGTRNTLGAYGGPAAVVGTAITAPGKVVLLRARSTRPHRVVVTWRPPRTGDPVATYQVRYKKKFGSYRAWRSTTQQTATLTRLVSGRSYVIQVRARNAAGPGPAVSRPVRVR